MTRRCPLPKDRSKFLAPIRLRRSTQHRRSPETETLSDKARIIASSSFRRLQTKAQVFSLEENAAVRSRLTHTLEVAIYGQLIATRAFGILADKGILDSRLGLPFIQTVENACYLHDIGNPPFGHLGEFAVREWFRHHEQVIKSWWKAGGVSPADADLHFESFRHFDGNSQGFRIVSRLQWLSDEYGLNLTCPLLASMIKYLAPRPVSGRPFGKKAGFFESERDRILDIWTKLGLKIEGQLPAQRHPLSFLMEAADDIAYCLSDIEDALEKGIIDDNSLQRKLPRNLLGSKTPQHRHDSKLRPRDAMFISYRIALTRKLVDIAARTFAAKYSAICNGDFHDHLFAHHRKAKDDLDELKEIAAEFIFPSREAVTIELSGHKILTTLLDHFSVLLSFSPDAFSRLLPERARDLKYGELALERRLFSRLPLKHCLN